MSRRRERFVLAAGERAKGLRARMEKGEGLRDYAAAGKDPGTAVGDLARPVLALNSGRDCGRDAVGGGARKEGGRQRWEPSALGRLRGGRGGSSRGGEGERRQRGYVVEQFLTVRGSWDPDLSS